MQERQSRRLRASVVAVVTSAVGVLLAASIGPARAQHLDFTTGINVTGTLSSNPDLAPKGQERSDAWLDISPYFTVTSTSDGKFRLSGGGSLGATARISARGEDTYSGYLRPTGNLNGTWEAVDNFFFVDVRAGVQSQLDDPFLATTDPTSPVNTSTSYQVGITPYVRGKLAWDLDYEVRSDNSWTNDWTDSPDYSGQYSAVNSLSIERIPQPFGGAFVFEQRLLSSDIEDQSLLETQTARISLRYALTDSVAVGARMGAERYNFTLGARDWQRYYGAEISWRPNRRTNLEGFWEDRVFGNSWNAVFSYRRPRASFNISTSRGISSTPQQFATFPGLANLASLLDAAFATRIPDPVERQRTVIDLLSRSQLPAELLTPTIIRSEGFSIEQRTDAGVVLYGKRYTVGLTAFWTTTETSAGLSSVVPTSSETQERGAELVFNRSLTPIANLTAYATWRNTENRLNASQQTTQTQLRLETSVDFGQRTYGTLGARYQWVSSTVTNDATEAALYFTLNYSFD